MIRFLEVTAVTAQPAFYAAVLNLFVDPPVDLLEGFPPILAESGKGPIFVLQWINFLVHGAVDELSGPVAQQGQNCGIR